MKIIKFLLIILLVLNTYSVISQSYIGFGFGGHTDFFSSKQSEIQFTPSTSFNANIHYEYRLNNNFIFNSTIQYKISNIEYSYIKNNLHDIRFGKRYNTLNFIVGSGYSFKVQKNTLTPRLNIGLCYLTYNSDYRKGNFQFNYEIIETTNSNKFLFPLIQIGLEYQIKLKKRNNLLLSPFIYYTYTFSEILSDKITTNYTYNSINQFWSGNLSYVSFGTNFQFHVKSIKKRFTTKNKRNAGFS